MTARDLYYSLWKKSCVERSKKYVTKLPIHSLFHKDFHKDCSGSVRELVVSYVSLTHRFKIKKEAIPKNSLKLWFWAHCFTGGARVYSKRSRDLCEHLCRAYVSKGIHSLCTSPQDSVLPWFIELSSGLTLKKKQKCIIWSSSKTTVRVQHREVTLKKKLWESLITFLERLQLSSEKKWRPTKTPSIFFFLIFNKTTSN